MDSFNYDGFFDALEKCDLDKLRRFQPKLTSDILNIQYIMGKKTAIYALFNEQHSEQELIEALKILLSTNQKIEFFDREQNDAAFPSPLKQAIKWKYFKLAKKLVDNIAHDVDNLDNLQKVLDWEPLKTTKNVSDEDYKQSIENSKHTKEEKDIMEYIYDRYVILKHKRHELDKKSRLEQNSRSWQH